MWSLNATDEGFCSFLVFFFFFSVSVFFLVSRHLAACMKLPVITLNYSYAGL